MTSSVTFHDSLTYIGENAFSGCRFTSLTLPASVDSLGSYAFTSCEWLTEINLDHISKIGTYAFQNNFNLKSANILKAQNVADKSFWECKNIETFVLPYYGWTENFKMDFSSSTSELTEKKRLNPLTGFNLLNLGFIGFVVGFHLTCTTLQTNATIKPTIRKGARIVSTLVIDLMKIALIVFSGTLPSYILI